MGIYVKNQLLVTVHDLMQHRDTKSQIDMAILDFSKAYDTVPHDKVLGTLQHYSIQGPILDWISILLMSRDQCVVAGRDKSEPIKVDLGAQGTVLGPPYISSPYQ